MHVLEFGLQRIEVRTFEIYFFVICYAALFFLPSISIRDRNGPASCSARAITAPFASIVMAAEIHWIAGRFEALA